jgi:hypothetical protein
MRIQRKILPVIAIPLCFVVLYDFTATRAFSYDGLSYALAIERNAIPYLFCSYHMLHSVIGWVVFKGMTLVGHPLRALLLLQRINALVAGCTVGVFFWILSREFGQGRALVGAAALGFSCAFWTEAVDPGCYVWATLASCFLLGVLVAAETWSSFRIGIVHGIMILFHQMMVLAIPAVLVKRWRRQPGAYLAGVFVTAGSVYAAVAAVFYGQSMHEALIWFFGPAGWPPGRPLEVLHWWDFQLLHNLLATWRGLVYSLVVPIPDGHPLLAMLEYGVEFVFVALLGTAGLRYFKGKKFAGETLPALAVWILVMNVVFIFYVPGSMRFRLLFLPALIYLALALESRHKNRWSYTAAGAVLTGMVMLNYGFAIGPQSHQENNPSLVRTVWISHTLRPQDVFLFAGGEPSSITNIYLPYFAPHVNGRSLRGYFFEHPGGDLKELRQMVLEAHNSHQRVFVEAALFNPETQKELEALGQMPPGALQKWLDGLGLRRAWIGLAAGGYGMYGIR